MIPMLISVYRYKRSCGYGIAESIRYAIRLAWRMY
jgi:hypothetical protein